MHLRRHSILNQASRLGLCALVLGGGIAPPVSAQEIEPPIRPDRVKAAKIQEPTKPVEREEEDIAVSAALGKLKLLQTELETSQAKVKQLSEALAQSASESEQAKEKLDQMRLQMEAFGLGALDKEERPLQLRLLNAVNDLRLSEKDKEQISEQLIELSEAAIAYVKSGDDDARDRLETTIEASNLSLKSAHQKAQPKQVPIEESKVVSLKSEIGLAVMNAGRESGIKCGLPVRFVRGGKFIGAGVVVDVRDTITGILITNTEKETNISVGDNIKLEPTKNEKKE